MRNENSKVPGPWVPAFLRLVTGVALAISLAAPGAAQQQGANNPGFRGQQPVQQPVQRPLQQVQQAQPPRLPPGLPPAAIRPVPDQLQLAKLIWSTMVAVDQGNKSGNYSVLRDISSTGFQINNDPAKLAQVFANIRSSRIDLSDALLVPPTYTIAPQQIQADVFRVQGVFSLRPIAIAFDLYFQWERGEWRLYGIDIRPLAMNETLNSTRQ